MISTAIHGYIANCVLANISTRHFQVALPLWHGPACSMALVYIAPFNYWRYKAGRERQAATGPVYLTRYLANGQRAVMTEPIGEKNVLNTMHFLRTSLKCDQKRNVGGATWCDTHAGQQA
jgi:hypothetical protein